MYQGNNISRAATHDVYLPHYLENNSLQLHVGQSDIFLKKNYDSQ